jgi:uncharacterized phage infection (PIP) family protein YhgE
MTEPDKSPLTEFADTISDWADQDIRWRRPSLQRITAQLRTRPLKAVLLLLESQGQAALAARLERTHQALVREAGEFDALCRRQAQTESDTADEGASCREFDSAKQSLQASAHELADMLRAVDELLAAKSLPGTDAESEHIDRLQDLSQQLALGQEVLAEQLQAASAISETLEAAVNATRDRSDSKNFTGRQARRMEWTLKAMLLVDQHPDWPDCRARRLPRSEPEPMTCRCRCRTILLP